MVKRLAPFLVFAALAVILLWPVLLGGEVLLPGDMLQQMAPWNDAVVEGQDIAWNALTWDSIAYFYPARVFLGKSLREGVLPLWNPHQMCGIPFLANWQSAVLYPPNWLFAVIPPAQAFGWLAFLHLFAAGAFMYIFLRGLGLGRTASTFGGIAFMLSGFAVTWLELPVFLSTAIWLPPALHCSRMAHEKGAARYAIVAGVAVALSILGGHPQIAFYSVLALGLYWLYLGISGWRKTSPFRTLVMAGLTFGIGIMLAAPQIYPALELAEFSHRGGTNPTAQGYAAYSSLAMSWQRLTTFFMPYFHGDGASTEFSEYCGYVGVLPLLLLIPAFGLRGRGYRHTWFFTGLTALALAMSLGTGVNRLFYFGIPGFANSGSPGRALFLVMFSVTILGAVGLDRVLRADDAQRRWAVWTSISSAVIPMLGVWLAYNVLISMTGNASMSDLLSCTMPHITLFIVLSVLGIAIAVLAAFGRISRQMGGVLILALIAADLLTFGMSYNRTCSSEQVYSRPPTIKMLRQPEYGRIMPLNDKWSLVDTPESVLPPNAAMALRLYDVQGYDALYPVRYKALLDAAAGRDSCPPENGNMVFARNPESPVYDLLGVQWFVSAGPMPGARKMEDGCYVLRNKGALPRAFLVHTIEFADDEESLRRLAEGELDPKVVALVDMADSRRLNPWRVDGKLKPNGAIPPHDAVVIRHYSPNLVRMSVAAASPGLLVLSDQYYPGWKVKVDEKPAEIGRVNYVLRGVPVQAGTHTVEFRYEPESFDKGLRLFRVALVMIGGMLIYVVARWFEGRRAKVQ